VHKPRARFASAVLRSISSLLVAQSPLGHFRDAGQLEIQVTRHGAQPVQFDLGGRRNAIRRVVVAGIVRLAN